MKNLVIVGLLVVLVLAYTVPRSSAQDGSDNPYPIAPVQVEYKNADQLIVADCYPLYSGNQSTTLFVYINLESDGVAVYACEEAHGGFIQPIPQARDKVARYSQ